MTARITIFEPTAEPKETVATDVPDMKDLAGKKVVFVSNESWQCMPTMWRRLHQLLIDRNKVSDVLKVPVPMQKPAPPEALDEVTKKGEVAIVGLGI